MSTSFGPVRLALSLLRTPCAVCGLPAMQVLFHDEVRMVTHLGKRPCIIPNPEHHAAQQSTTTGTVGVAA